MSLEILERGATTAAHPVPLLFVHGAQHAAWCWDDNFLGYFAEHGYRSVALSLSGHGTSNSKPVGACSIADFVEDIRSVSDELPTAPVLIGHSMGGYVVQRYLQRYPAAAAVLLASLPPTGIAGALRRSTAIRMRMRMAHPGRRVEMADYLRVLFFDPATPDALVTNCVQRLSMETPARALAEMMLPVPTVRNGVTAPVLVMGGASDPNVIRSDLRSTAAAYHTVAQVVPNVGHDLMLEPGWREVADRMRTWLGSCGF